MYRICNFFLINSWRIVAIVTKMGQIELSKSILIKLMHHLKSVPLLYSNMVEALHRINLYCKSSFQLYLLYATVYFLVIIFPPHTTVEVDLSIQRCFFYSLNLIHRLSQVKISSIVFLIY